MKGTTATRIGIIKTGTFLYFYENGKRKSILNYEKDKPFGTYFEFHENGEKKFATLFVGTEYSPFSLNSSYTLFEMSSGDS